MTHRQGTFPVNPSLVREFALEGPGNFEDLSGRMRRTHVAWSTSFAEQSAVIGYPIGAGSENLVDLIIQSAEECGFQITKTRSRVIRDSGLVMPHEEKWQDFAEFLAARPFMRTMREAPPVRCGHEDNVVTLLPLSHFCR
jgi:hypothetical protein